MGCATRLICNVSVEAVLTLTLSVIGPLLITASKRSLEQGNVFYTCLFTGDLPTGRSASEGVWQTPSPELEKRAVRITLECFLVTKVYLHLAKNNNRF